MEVVQRTLAYIGAGTLIGFGFIGLHNWERVTSTWWIGAGIGAMFLGRLIWGVLPRNTIPKPQYPTILKIAPASGRMEQIQQEFKAYGLAFIAAAALFTLGTAGGTTQTPRYVSASLILQAPDAVLFALAALFLAAGVALIAGLRFRVVTAWFREQTWTFLWLHPLVGLIAIGGIAAAWFTTLPVATSFPTAIVYAYFYGGAFLLIALGVEFVRDSLELVAAFRAPQDESDAPSLDSPPAAGDAPEADPAPTGPADPGPLR